ncbi:hypothetical protein F5883DRAFT_575314 [Diaporthe sp. PMI_573]|nr:hypothetical protein F5883DRAFT_575314 [Diaporthaceae sp. PMI_573]
MSSHDLEGNGDIANADICIFESGNPADATFVCGDRVWKVHKIILSSRCKWFKAAFYGNFAEAVSGEVVLEEQDADLSEHLRAQVRNRQHVIRRRRSKRAPTRGS